MTWSRLGIVALLIVAVVASSVVPRAYRPELFHGFSPGDHALGYFILSFAVALLMRRQHVLLLGAALAALAVSMEAIQMFLPSRTACIRDLSGSLVGILIGLTAARAIVLFKQFRSAA